MMERGSNFSDDLERDHNAIMMEYLSNRDPYDKILHTDRPKLSQGSTLFTKQ
jgi:hypothetical protein